ncbi:sodium/hydrogen exchanger 9B1 isoform X3 [Folsomia candida]|nr:sodium/hydrogen exchanger 9B1 isoform X3 [Folsomia candida]
MFCAGLLLRNVPRINVAKNLSLEISSPLRGISVVILLTRGAFGVNMINIRKFRNVVPSLAIGSCIIEAVFAGLSVFYILGFSPAWAALMGCIMSAMSGAAVMPYLLAIESKVMNDQAGTSLPKAKEVLLIAKTACGLDAILAICMAECALGFIFGNEEMEAGLVKGLAEVTLGGVFGIFWGGLSGVLLAHENDPDIKTIAVFSGGVMSLIGLSKIGYPRGGPLGTFLGAFVAVTIWKKKSDLTNLTCAYDKLWFIFQPLLFGIIGARTDFEIFDWTVIYKGVGCLLISTVVRIFASYLMTSWVDISFRERIFLVLAWTGKGTVQAALGPVALDTAIDLGLENEQLLAQQIMNIAAMIILLSSFSGFLALKFFGHSMLTR